MAARHTPLPPRKANITREQLETCIKSADEQFKDFCRLLYLTGARPSEVIKVVQGAKISNGVAIIESSQSKRKSEHRIYLNEEAQKLVGKHPYKTKFGTLYYREYVTALLRRLSIESGVKVRPYDLRHSVASRLLKSKVPTATAAKLLNTSVIMLDRVYGQLSDDELVAISEHLV
jgi:integrase